MLKYALVLTLFALLFVGCDEENNNPTASGGTGGVSIDHVDGLQGGKIPASGTITFHIRMNNSEGDDVKGFTNGFRIYGPSGTSWTTTSAEATGVLDSDDFDFIWQVGSRSVTGTQSDTVTVIASVLNNTVGMEAGFNDITHTITVGPVNATSTGRSLCIDSCYFPNSGKWLWAPGGAPSWSGPHCYQIQ